MSSLDDRRRYIVQTAERRVYEGMRFLDRNVPEWIDWINIEKLDIGSIWYCVLAQLTRRLYAEAADMLALTCEEDRGRYAFQALGNDRIKLSDLTEAWKRGICARRQVLELAA